ncbi:MAG: hypothetical protein JW795_00585 [Chitinivibrionales bacterium]|nr:hypothetical protein [Chitinivibrionales bacterium]
MVEVIKWMKNPVPYTQYHFNPPNTSIAAPSSHKSATPLSITVVSKSRIAVTMPVSGVKKMTIYSIRGARVVDIVSDHSIAATRTLDLPAPLASGSYILSLAGSPNASVRFVVYK